MKKLLSIIIVTYNSERLIFDCLDSIYKYNDLGNALEVIIVDNNSNDQDAVFSRIRNEYPEDIILIKNATNNGYGSGNNLGVENATANRFIVINPDVRLLNSIFLNLLKSFDTNHRIAMLGVTFSDKSCPLYFKPEYYSLLRFIFFKVYVSLYLFDMNRMYISGSFLMFDKKAFIEAGKFDPKFFLYYEEADISNRIINIGKDIVLAKNIMVNHLTHNRGFNPDLASFEIESLVYYLEKYKFKKMRVLNKYQQVFKLKYFIASITFNKPKKNLFKNWVELIENHKKILLKN